MVATGRDAGRWSAYAALGVTGAILLGAAAANQKSQRAGQPIAGQTKDHPLYVAPAFAPAERPYTSGKSCEKPQSAEQENICIEREAAQAARDQANWSFATFVVGVFGTAGILATLGATAIAARAAQRSAKAAEGAVKALPTIERAHVYPEIISPGSVARLLEEALVYYLDGLDSYDKPAEELAEVTIALTNFGKTPAIIKDVYASIGVGIISARVGLSAKTGALGSGKSTNPIPVVALQGFTRNQATNIGLYTEHVGISGLVQFEDIWGVEYHTDFYFYWNKEIGNFVLTEVKTKEAKKP